MEMKNTAFSYLETYTGILLSIFLKTADFLLCSSLGRLAIPECV